MIETVTLGNVSLFAELPPDQLAALQERVRVRRYGRGDVVFYAGDPGLSLCIIRAGHFKLTVSTAEGHEMGIDLLGPGEVFGELALFDGAPRSADAIATEPGELMLLDRDEFIHFLLERPSVAVHLLTILAQRLRRDARLLEDVAFLDVPARLARTILRFAVTPPTGGQPTTPRLTQTDLAGLVGTTRETLNKWLGVFEDQGLIRRLDKGRVSVLDSDRLRQRIV